MKHAFAAAIVLALAAPAHANDAPDITSFDGGQLFGDWYLFEGEVDDEDPDSCVVHFGDFLDGFSTTVNSDGTFSLLVELVFSVPELVSAVAEDNIGQDSTEATTVILP